MSTKSLRILTCDQCGRTEQIAWGEDHWISIILRNPDDRGGPGQELDFDQLACAAAWFADEATVVADPNELTLTDPHVAWRGRAGATLRWHAGRYQEGR